LICAEYSASGLFADARKRVLRREAFAESDFEFENTRTARAHDIDVALHNGLLSTSPASRRRINAVPRNRSNMLEVTLVFDTGNSLRPLILGRERKILCGKVLKLWTTGIGSVR
jgi:hypothetical protein